MYTHNTIIIHDNYATGPSLACVLAIKGECTMEKATDQSYTALQLTTMPCSISVCYSLLTAFELPSFHPKATSSCC